MSLQSSSFKFSSPPDYFSFLKGKAGSREASQDSPKYLKKILAVMTIFFLSGIILWTVGSALPSSPMAITGKIFFAASFAPIPIAIGLICFAVCQGCCCRH